MFVVSTLKNLLRCWWNLVSVIFRALLTCVPTFNNIHKYLIPFAYYFCSIINSWTCAIYIALLSDRGFETGMISLWVFSHFCVGHGYTNQELSSGKSSLERFLKKSEKFIIFSLFCMKNFAGWFDLFFDSILLILIQFPFIW